MLSSRSVRALKGLTAAAVSTFVALLSHVAGGAPIPGMLGLIVPLVLAFPICVALAGRRLSMLRLAASVGISQFLFHSLFVLGSTTAVASTGALGASMTALGPHAGHDKSIVMDTSVIPIEHLQHAGPTMWVAHVIAAVLTVIALRRGESALVQIWVIAGSILRRILPTQPVLGALPLTLRRIAPSFAAPTLAPTALGFFPNTAPRRGPPTLAFL